MSLIQTLCPHWYWPVPMAAGGEESELFQTVKQERCKLCGKVRTYARVREPTWPSQSREELVEEMEQPNQELVVVEWLNNETDQ